MGVSSRRWLRKALVAMEQAAPDSQPVRERGRWSAGSSYFSWSVGIWDGAEALSAFNDK
jgi:hypothetical protein